MCSDYVYRQAHQYIAQNYLILHSLVNVLWLRFMYIYTLSMECQLSAYTTVCL